MPNPRYKRIVLFLSFLLMLVLGMIDFAVPFLLDPIIKDMNLTYAQGGLLFGTLYLGFIFYGPIGGAVTEKLGVRKSIAIATFVQSLAAILRGYSVGFYDLFFFSLIVSICSVMQIAGIGRAMSEWFPSEELGTVNGVWNAGFALGALIVSATTATIVLPAMGGWRGSFILYGVIDLAAAVVYITFSREKPTDYQIAKSASASNHVVGRTTMRRGFLQVAKSRNIWLLFAIFALVTGAENAAISWMPQLLGMKGAGAVLVELAGTMVWVGGITGNILFPYLSDRLGLRKPVLLGTAPLLAISIYVLLASSSGSVSLFAGLMLGFTSMYFFPMMITIASELPEVSGGLVASAAGFVITASGLGTFILPVLGGYLRDVSGSFSMGFSLYWLVALLALPAIVLLSETGSRRRKITMGKAN